MLNFIKRYWFVVFITVFILLYLSVFLLVLISPKQDELNRGFVPCTREMAQQILSDEEKSSIKLVGIIFENSYCDVKVVVKGFSNWIKGEQKTPWENYLFEPQVYRPIEATDEELLKFYKENPNISKDMEELNRQRLKLEQMLLETGVIEEENLPSEEISQENETVDDLEEAEVEENEQNDKELESE